MVMVLKEERTMSKGWKMLPEQVGDGDHERSCVRLGVAQSSLDWNHVIDHARPPRKTESY